MKDEIIRVGQIGIRFLLEPADTNGSVAMFEFTVPVGAKVPVAGIDPRVVAGQNRALVYDPRRRLVLLVVGTGGDRGTAKIYALRYQHAEATFVGPDP